MLARYSVHPIDDHHVEAHSSQRQRCLEARAAAADHDHICVHAGTMAAPADMASFHAAVLKKLVTEIAAVPVAGVAG